MPDPSENHDYQQKQEIAKTIQSDTVSLKERLENKQFFITPKEQIPGLDQAFADDQCDF